MTKVPYPWRARFRSTFFDHAVARGVDGVAHVARQVDPLVHDVAAVDRVAAHAEGADTVAQLVAVDRPRGGDRRGEFLLVLGQDLQLVERDGLQVELPCQRIHLLPCADHQRRVAVVGHGAVLFAGVFRVDAVERERVGREERAVDRLVAVADLGDLALGGLQPVLHDAVLHHQLAVRTVDAVHLRRIEEIGKEDVGHRDEDESDEYFAQQAVGTQPERSRDNFVGKGLRIESVFFFAMPEKTQRERANLG